MKNQSLYQTIRRSLTIDVTHTNASDKCRSGVRRPKGKRSKNQLLITALAIVVGGLLAAGAFAEFGDTSADAKSAPLGEESAKLIGKASTNYAGSFSTISTQAIISNAYLKHTSHLTANGTAIVVTPGNGSLVVTPGTITTAGDSGNWAFSGLDDSTCQDTANSLSSVANVLIVNGATVKANLGNYNAGSVACDQGTNSVVAIAN